MNKYRIGQFFIWALGLYLGLVGLDLALTESNLSAGIPLFLAALVILPPPAGITNIIESKINYTIPGGLKLAVSTILLFIAWFNLPATI